MFNFTWKKHFWKQLLPDKCLTLDWSVFAGILPGLLQQFPKFSCAGWVVFLKSILLLPHQHDGIQIWWLSWPSHHKSVLLVFRWDPNTSNLDSPVLMTWFQSSKVHCLHNFTSWSTATCTSKLPTLVIFFSSAHEASWSKSPTHSDCTHWFLSVFLFNDAANSEAVRQLFLKEDTGKDFSSWADVRLGL